MFDKYRSVTENGIVTLYYKPEERGEEEIVISLPATSIVDRADRGDWDEQNALAFQLLMAWLKTLPTGQPIDDIRFFRWIVAHVWVKEQKEKHHGKAIFKLENSSVVFPLFLSTERSALANNIEGALIARFGHEQGIKNAVIFYQQMLVGSPGQGLSLSDFGKHVLTELHRGFIEEGIPQMAFNKPEVFH
ncbi:hypothetical protein Xbed_03177 [Xenorhabdus beddingii]|uniref:Uncharacterized protein n=1 Tax=Xenorhabdus beddingii TaxID=40578 RepID=A0A1Y2SKR9_9GAMM|nr:hypothetical protein [Xenorhabdus beddingii]OTA18178.1 hypothetical protein Xbed_03177 [Xenorhabdus beddingii]